MRWHGGIGGDRSGRIVNKTTGRRQMEESEGDPDSSWRLKSLDRDSVREHPGAGRHRPAFFVLPIQIIIGSHKSNVLYESTNTSANTNAR